MPDPNKPVTQEPELKPELDPEFAEVGRRLAAAGLTAAGARNIAEVRAAQERIGDFMAQRSPPAVLEENLHIELAEGEPVPARLFRTSSTGTSPLMIYLHGGGFSQGSLSTWTPFARRMANRAGVSVLLVDYALAPESPFPRAFEQIHALVRALCDANSAQAARLGVDGANFALGGDSAGANLALGTAMALRDAGDPQARFLLLFYGVYSGDMASPSWQAQGAGPTGLSASSMRAIWKNYTGHEQPPDDWRITPASGNLRDLPAAWTCVGSLDPLLDDALRLRQRMIAAGGQCALRLCDGLPHAFVRHGGWVRSVDAALAEGFDALRVAMTPR